MREEDLEAVLEIESASFSRPWTRRHFSDELASPFGYPVVAVMPDGSVAGYLCMKQVLDEAEILDVAVSVSLRGRGVGRLLVETALAAARGRGGTVVSLEVRVGNREAIALYERLGFHEMGRRRQYYENGEDAILMEYTG
ncbi:MAG: ribosomal-protein-alanine N-acetyltransferase [Geobacteraceae bacterium GWC2_58_44]|nr:MAG: ribosomal-protein-alanine N-acetyltransferase [Geobacteraceae bacterium GWC2_58_44]HBG04203.1 ribosomal-protein-alanine N-acetyltransferase [Geobacter sp.]